MRSLLVTQSVRRDAFSGGIQKSLPGTTKSYRKFMEEWNDGTLEKWGVEEDEIMCKGRTILLSRPFRSWLLTIIPLFHHSTIPLLWIVRDEPFLFFR